MRMTAAFEQTSLTRPRAAEQDLQVFKALLVQGQKRCSSTAAIIRWHAAGTRDGPAGRYSNPAE
jgi:hypothetical protein